MNIVYTDRARQDLLTLFDYIANTLLSPDAARRTADAVMNAVRGLSDMPERYPLYRDEPWHSRNVRFVPVKNYLAFYVADGDTVTVIRILYAERDVSGQLEEETKKGLLRKSCVSS